MEGSELLLIRGFQINTTNDFNKFSNLYMSNKNFRDKTILIGIVVIAILIIITNIIVFLL